MYSPKIEPEQVRKLYLLKKSYESLGLKKPMTKIVQEALNEYIPKVVQKILESNENLPVPEELTNN